MKRQFLGLALGALAFYSGAAGGAELVSPHGLRWGSSPQEVHAQLMKSYQYVGPTTPANLDQFLYEQRFSGEILGIASDAITPLFFAGQLFALGLSFSPSPTLPASLIWEKLVEKLAAQYGKPVSRTKPLELLSFNAILRLLPPEANKGKLMELYNAADKDRGLGRYMLLDLQIQSGGWVPEARWTFTNGASVKAVMRAGEAGEYGLSNLKPAVLYTRYEQLK